MLFKESVETLKETPLRVQKAISNIKELQSNSEKHFNKINEQLESPDGKPDNMISAFLRIEENEKALSAHLNSLNQFLNEQVSIVEKDCDNFDETVSKSTLIIKTNQISRKELGYHTNGYSEMSVHCVCGKDSNEKMIACDGLNCKIEWYHLSCVGLTYTPTEKWICNECKRRNK